LIEYDHFENEVLVRELKILREIAIQHNLLELFNQLLATTKRKVIVLDQVYGFIITNSIRFEGTELGVNNIFDASLATNFVYNFYNKMSIKEAFSFFRNMARIILRNKKYKLEDLPKIN
jgi:hypothetical protein